jgi:hypothetical protein
VIPIWLLLFLMTLVLFPQGHARAEQVRFHGLPLDDQHELIVAQPEPGLCRVGILSRSRPEGGMGAEHVRLKAGPESGRMEEAAYFLEVRSEVVKPAQPTYLQNTGALYRLTVAGIDEGPDYEAVRLASAGDARQVLTEEFRTLWRKASGVEREALFWGLQLVLSAFKEEQLMPAPLHAAVGESEGAQERVDPRTLQRKRLPVNRGVEPEDEQSEDEGGSAGADADERTTPADPRLRIRRR